MIKSQSLLTNYNFFGMMITIVDIGNFSTFYGHSLLCQAGKQELKIQPWSLLVVLGPQPTPQRTFVQFCTD